MSRKDLKTCSTLLKASMQIEYFHLSMGKNQNFIVQNVGKNM